MSLPPHQRPNQRPRPEFWEEFNRGLREKQLAALVKQPHGWARFRPIFVRSFRWSVPATVAAMATFGFVRHIVIAPAIVVEQTPAPVNVSAPPAVANLTPDRAQVSDFPAVETVRFAETPAARERPIPFTTVATSAPSVPIREVEQGSTAAENRSQDSRVSLTTAVVHAATEVLQQPAEYVQARLDAAASFGQQVAQLTARPDAGPVGSWGDFDSRLMQVTALDLRVTTEHAGNLMTTPVSYSPQPREKVRLTDDEREYRDVSRFGVQGSSLSIRF